MTIEQAKFRVLIVANKPYITHLIPLVRSLDTNYPDIRLTICLVNCDEPTTNGLKKELSEVRFQIDYIERTTGSLEESKIPAYCANIRAVLLNELLEQSTLPLLYLDADSIVRASLDGLHNVMASHDLLIHQRMGNTDDRLRVATGVILVNTTDAAKEFLQSWSERLSQQLDTWYADQASFYSCMELLRDKTKIGHLPKSYIDWDFLSVSKLWAGKGERKLSNRLYSMEIAKYSSDKLGKHSKIVYSLLIMLNALTYYFRRLIRSFVQVFRVR